MGPTWSVPPAFNPLTSSLTFAASTPATLASLMHLEHTTHMAIGLLHLLFPLPRTLSSRHPHGSLSVFFRSLFKCYLVREAFPDPSLKIATPLSPLSVPLVLIFSIAPFNIFSASLNKNVSFMQAEISVSYTHYCIPGARHGLTVPNSEGC